MSLRILVVGKSARMDCILETISRSTHKPELYAYTEVRHPGLFERTKEIYCGSMANVPAIVEYAKEISPSFVIIGPEEPLALGVADELSKHGISCVGPKKILAQLETNKVYTRDLFEVHDIPGNPEYRVFYGGDGLSTYLTRLGDFVIKPFGLTGGKGVRIFHSPSYQDGLEYCDQLFRRDGGFIVEEYLEGEEFSLQMLTDGYSTIMCPPVQDYKKAYDGNKGPNTGGMGSYSCADHLLPFLSEMDLEYASHINNRVLTALQEDTGHLYQGVIYGGFIKTAKGIFVLEYNARFGDPEAMNVLPLLQGDFVEICEGIVDGYLANVTVPVSFAHQASVCKYIVPKGYPENPVKKKIIQNIPCATENLKVYYGSVTSMGAGLTMQGSRAIALVGFGSCVAEAGAIAEEAAASITGPVYYRHDIGIITSGTSTP